MASKRMEGYTEYRNPQGVLIGRSAVVPVSTWCDKYKGTLKGWDYVLDFFNPETYMDIKGNSFFLDKVDAEVAARRRFVRFRIKNEDDYLTKLQDAGAMIEIYVEHHPDLPTQWIQATFYDRPKFDYGWRFKVDEYWARQARSPLVWVPDEFHIKVTPYDVDIML